MGRVHGRAASLNGCRASLRASSSRQGGIFPSPRAGGPSTRAAGCSTGVHLHSRGTIPRQLCLGQTIPRQLFCFLSERRSNHYVLPSDSFFSLSSTSQTSL